MSSQKAKEAAVTAAVQRRPSYGTIAARALRRADRSLRSGADGSEVEELVRSAGVLAQLELADALREVTTTNSAQSEH
jgi:hypothetical protein